VLQSDYPSTATFLLTPHLLRHAECSEAPPPSTAHFLPRLERSSGVLSCTCKATLPQGTDYMRWDEVHQSPARGYPPSDCSICTVQLQSWLACDTDLVHFRWDGPVAMDLLVPVCMYQPRLVYNLTCTVCLSVDPVACMFHLSSISFKHFLHARQHTLTTSTTSTTGTTKITAVLHRAHVGDVVRILLDTPKQGPCVTVPAQGKLVPIRALAPVGQAMPLAAGP
jgi:hypothetical protein